MTINRDESKTLITSNKGVDKKETPKWIKNISDKYTEHRDTWNFVIGTIITLVGIVVSIATAFVSPNNIAIAASVICCQIFVFITSLVTFLTFKKNKEIIEDTITKCNLSTSEANEQVEKTEQKYVDSRNFTNKLLVFSKNINKRINNFLTRICDESDKLYTTISYIQDSMENQPNGSGNTEYFKSQILSEHKKYQESLYSLYQSYIRGVVEEVLSIIHYHLKSKEIDLTASVSLKLFNTTYHEATDDYKKLLIYTAFRDKATYEKKEREIGTRHFSIDLNGDFHICLTKENYVKNNITNESEDYLNENHPGSMQYYNCTAVVPIICDYKADKNVFGFLCCDVLNETYDCNVFDKETAHILYITALTIGMFLDTINSAWAYTIADEDPDFLSFLHNKIYKGK